METGKIYHLKIVVRGTRIKCYADDRLLIDYDTANPAEATAYQVVSQDNNGNVIIKLVNVTEQKKTFAVQLNGFDPTGRECEYTSLTGESMEAEEGVVASGKLDLNDSSFNFTAAPRSVTVIRFN